ncbi:MAG: class I SAM-dependent methyltransferase [Verrucomicrobiae bacterium]|nr:class I SAM-dependent methyltransferase [Verrucomicrobiae bacterium]
MATNLETSEPNYDYGILEKLHRGKIGGKVSDKWASYLKAYNRLFAPFAKQPVRLLEIGVQNGGSFEVWSKFFADAKVFVGCDINPLCQQLTYEDPRIHIVVGDANQDATRDRIRQISPQFDLIIDDGSHVSKDIIHSFNSYFPLLAPGGIYVVEDTHCLYWLSQSVGLRQRRNATAFFKTLTDVVNYEHWSINRSIPGRLKRFLPGPLLAEEIKTGWVQSVEFRNSMIIIRKEMEPTHAKLGERVIVGTVAAVEPGVLKIRAGEKVTPMSWKDPRNWFRVIFRS